MDNKIKEPEFNQTQDVEETNGSLGSLGSQKEFQGSPTPGVELTPFETNVATDSTLSPHLLHFTTNQERFQNIKPGYHIANERDLRKINLLAPTIQNTALWYLKNISESKIHYLFKNEENNLDILSVTFKKENFIHLTGIRPEGKNQSAEKSLLDFASGNGNFENITVGKGYIDKLQALAFFPELVEAKSFMFTELSKIEKFKRLDVSQGIRTDDKDLLVAFRTMNGTTFPATLIRPKQELNLQLDVQSNAQILGVFKEKDEKLELLTVNNEFVKDKGIYLENFLKQVLIEEKEKEKAKESDQELQTNEKIQIEQTKVNIIENLQNESNVTKQVENPVLKSIKFQTPEFSPEYEGDENGIGKTLEGNLHLEIEDIEPLEWNNDDQWFVRASLVDERNQNKVIYTPFVMDKLESSEVFSDWWDEGHSEAIERQLYAEDHIQTLLSELEFRNLPEQERQAIIDEKNGVVNLFDTQEPEPLLGIEQYEKFNVDYHPAFENNRAIVNVSTGEKDISFAKDEDGELIVAASYRVDDLSNDEKREMKEIAEFKINHPEKSMQEFSIMRLQDESKQAAVEKADDGTKMFEFQFYDELVPESYDADKNTVKINFTARDTINYQHHQFVAEADLLTPLTGRQKIKLSTARFFENNKDISKNIGVLEWTESRKKLEMTIPKKVEKEMLKATSETTSKVTDETTYKKTLENTYKSNPRSNRIPKALVEQAQRTSIFDYASSKGMPLKKTAQTEFNIPGTKIKFSSTKNIFRDYAGNTKGNGNREYGGVIDFAKYMNGMNFREAVKDVLETEGAGTFEINTERQPFVMPTEIFDKNNTDQAFHYLVDERQLDPELVNTFIKDGLIKQTRYGEIGFVWANGKKDVGLTIQGTKPLEYRTQIKETGLGDIIKEYTWKVGLGTKAFERPLEVGKAETKALAEEQAQAYIKAQRPFRKQIWNNPEPHQGFNFRNTIPKDDITKGSIVIGESAIDLMSYYKTNGQNFGNKGHQVVFQSLEGSTTKINTAIASVERFEERYGKIPNDLIIATDNDHSGHEVMRLLQEDPKIQAYQKQGLKLLREIPKVGKDWNEPLQMESKTAPKVQIHPTSQPVQPIVNFQSSGPRL